LEFLLQRNWYSTVRLDEEGQDLFSEVTYCGTDREVHARLIVDPNTFLVKSANWETYRTPEGKGQRTLNLSQLEGMEAYFGCGGTLRQILAPLQEPYARALFAEAVRGLIQAETFLLKERGYPSKKTYEEHWYKVYRDSCRYFSNLDRISGGWYDYVGYSERLGVLFNRLRNMILFTREQDSAECYHLYGQLCDSYHEVTVTLVLDRDSLEVLEAEGHFLRVPDPVCEEAIEFVHAVEGKSLQGMQKKDLAHLLRGGDGCVHLIDLIYEGVETLSIWTAKQEGSV